MARCPLFFNLVTLEPFGNLLLWHLELTVRPLDKAGIVLKPGSIIESIDGETITPGKDIAQFLNRKAGKNILLTIAEGSAKRDISIKPITIGEEYALLYKRWVKRNQDEQNGGSHQGR